MLLACFLLAHLRICYPLRLVELPHQPSAFFGGQSIPLRLAFPRRLDLRTRVAWDVVVVNCFFHDALYEREDLVECRPAETAFPAQVCHQELDGLRVDLQELLRAYVGIQMGKPLRVECNSALACVADRLPRLGPYAAHLLERNAGSLEPQTILVLALYLIPNRPGVGLASLHYADDAVLLLRLLVAPEADADAPSVADRLSVLALDLGYASVTFCHFSPPSCNPR